MPSIVSRPKCNSKENKIINEKNNYFSYHKVIRDYLIKLVGTEKGWMLKKDIAPLIEIVGN